MLRHLLTALALSTLAAPAFARDIVLYEHDNFMGQKRTISTETSTLTPLGFNDAATSLYAEGEWEVCADDFFGGRCIVVSGEVRDLRPLGMHDAISSVRPARGGGGGGGGGGYDREPRGLRGGLRLFDQTSFGGQKITLDLANDNLNGIGWNDRAYSLRVDGDWQICEDKYFGGRCVTVSRDITDLRSLGFEGRISSARPISDTYGYGGGGGYGPGGYGPGGGYGGGGYGPGTGYGGGDRDLGAEGRTASFFAKPRMSGTRISACLDDGYSCGRAAADLFCRDQGFRGSAYSAQSLNVVDTVTADRRSRTSRSRALEDVLCTR